MGIEQIRAAIAPWRESLLAHPVYGCMHTPAALRIFMQHHVFAVWDFMSLLKALQREICDAQVPWLPPQNALPARLINEIVLGEESDEDGRGSYASHLVLYLRSMHMFGADTAPLDRVLQRLGQGDPLEVALDAETLPPGVRQFVEQTFAIIHTGEPCRIAAAFTFGREDLLPAVFQKIVDQLAEQTGGGLAEFQYYLRRHIELDSDEHGPLATRLVADLCGDDPAAWQAAEQTAVASLQSRLTLWDAIHQAVLRDGS